MMSQLCLSIPIHGSSCRRWLFHLWCVCVHTVIMSILQAVLRYQKSSRARCWTSLGAIVKNNSCMCLCIYHIAHTRSHTQTHTCMSHFCVHVFLQSFNKDADKRGRADNSVCRFFCTICMAESLFLPPSLPLRACVRACVLPLSLSLLALHPLPLSTVS
jgi:hypothetical protein